jgi:hypothetical protein
MDEPLSQDSDVYSHAALDHLAHSRAGFRDDPAWLFTPDVLNAPHIKQRFKQPRRQLDPYALYISSHISLEGPYTEPSPSPSPTASPRGESPVDHRPHFSHGNNQLPTPSSLDALSRSSTWTNGTDFTNDHCPITRPHKDMYSAPTTRNKRRPKSKPSSPRKKLRRSRSAPEPRITKSSGRCNTHSMMTRSKASRYSFR